MRVQDAQISLLLSFAIVATIGWIVLVTTWIRERRGRAKSGSKTEMKSAEQWVRRRSDPLRRFRVIRPVGDFVHLEDQTGQRIVLTGRRFAKDYEASP